MTATSARRKQWLFISSRAPWDGSAPLACADLLLAAAVFDQDVSVVFLGAGVLQLLPDQDGSALGTKSFAKLFPALDLYEVRKVYADAAALRKWNLVPGALLLPVEPLDTAMLRTLLAQNGAVYVF